MSVCHCCTMYVVIMIHNISFTSNIHRESYMSAHVLLNLLNELGKRNKMRGLPNLLQTFML